MKLRFMPQRFQLTQKDQPQGRIELLDAFGSSRHLELWLLEPREWPPGAAF